jgi:uncharacterized protein
VFNFGGIKLKRIIRKSKNLCYLKLFQQIEELSIHMKRSGYADLPLHGGRIPGWLAERMEKLGGAIIEAVVQEYGKSEVLTRLSDPFWFQSLGTVMGMDWHSSGITTSVMGALKSAINPISRDLGIYICGGRGRHSRKTPAELISIACKTGVNGDELVRCSKLSAKIDNSAIQDGFQLYLHSFILTDGGEWSVIQQGMNRVNGMARRYHWHSASVKSFVDEPHTFVLGQNQGQILNLVAHEAASTQKGILNISKENKNYLIPEIKKLLMPRHHNIIEKDVDLKRLGTILALVQEQNISNFEELLLLRGVGPRTLQSLTLVSEVIHGTPSRFSDPARFSFAHGGKDGHPFPVPTKIYDETITILKSSVEKAKIGEPDKQKALKSLSEISRQLEKNFTPEQNLKELIQLERNNSWKHGGKSVFGDAGQSKCNKDQLKLF